jgi:hypothetical protein
MEENTTATTEVKRIKKLSKIIEGNVVVITEKLTGTTLRFDSTALPQGIQEKLTPFGLASKLGDAAAGKEGQDAVNAMQKVFDGLAAGDWTTRVPAEEKITKTSLLDKYNAMPEGKEKAMAKKILESLGLTVA